uniref:Uncharacterized protein n=1 Tax=Rhizophora mucronata TaxID=61149 RepID=A0A2P2QV95_RHIMU
MYSRLSKKKSFPRSIS